MNSEELEISLRTEFESYLKDVLAEMRQEANEFQSKIEAEFDKHKSQFDEAFQSFAERFDSKREFDEAFTSSVAEHLRLARDEGARITATAMAEAEKLDDHERETTIAVAEVPSYDRIRDAVNDISSKDSQSAILKALVQNAGEFAPRGAFFIIKNDHFVGWKVFGDQVETAEAAIKEIHLPTSSDSIIGTAVQTLSTVQNSSGSHSGDDSILTPLGFGEPDKMYAIPLMARGRGVAVLYADHGESGGAVNREALETLVRVAGLTVELLAASQTVSTDTRTPRDTEFEEARHETETTETTETVAEPEHVYFDSYRQENVQDEPVYEDEVVEATVSETESSGFAFSENNSFEGGFAGETAASSPTLDSQFDTVETVEEVTAEGSAFDSYEAQPFESEADATFRVEESADAGFAYDTNGSIPVDASSPFDQAVESYEPSPVVTGGGTSQVAEQVVEATPAAVSAAPYARLRDRPVDLPIEVPEDERRIHNDARRFARLLVSEIKLYNEKKVVEGRESQDLYERLREAIDRSREMYDKRVQPPVAEKFDYFHYEIVNSLADGEAQRLGSGYPGSTV